MTAHQYDQQCNQVICSSQGDHVWGNNGPNSNLFGLEPNFGCCTANMHQGWPKFASHLWMKTPDGGLAVVAYAPCLVETSIQGKQVKVTVETEYPFRDEIKITVTVPEPMSFPLHLRMPGWAEKAEMQTGDLTIVRGSTDVRADSIVREGSRPGVAQYHQLNARWSGTKSVRLRFPMPVRLYQGYNNAVAIERGPLVFALWIEAEWRKVKDNAQFADWEVYPKSPWNYALQIDRAHPERSVTFHEPVAGPGPFSPEGARVIARVKGLRLPGWGLERGAAAPPPSGPAAGLETLYELTLFPYGCTDLRITEFPVCH
jgi:hypothetical protein